MVNSLLCLDYRGEDSMSSRGGGMGINPHVGGPGGSGTVAYVGVFQAAPGYH